MKVVLTKQLCEISGYFKTLSEDPECKEIEISDEYSYIVDLMTDYTRQKHSDYLTLLIDEDNDKIIEKHRQYCDYFSSDVLIHDLRMIIYESQFNSRRTIDAMKILTEICEAYHNLLKYDIRLRFDTVEESLSEILSQYDQAIYLIPLSWWIKFFQLYPANLTRVLGMLFCPYEKLIIEEWAQVINKHTYRGVIQRNVYLSPRVKWLILIDGLKPEDQLETILAHRNNVKPDDISKFTLECIEYGCLHA